MINLLTKFCMNETHNYTLCHIGHFVAKYHSHVLLDSGAVRPQILLFHILIYA